MKLFLKDQAGHYSFMFPYTGPTGREEPVGNFNNIAFEGRGLSVGMSKWTSGDRMGAVVMHAELEDPTWKDLDDIADRVNRAWRVAYGDTAHVFFEGASLHSNTIWLYFGS